MAEANPFDQFDDPYPKRGAGSVALGGAQTYPGVAAELGSSDPWDKYEDAPPNLLEQAKQDYPVLGKSDMQYKYNPAPDRGYLEYWPPGEEGTQEYKRPSEFQMDKPGVEVYRKDTRPIDILGDVVSHGLMNTDPKIKAYYDEFEKSMEPWQKQRLKEQYKHAAANEGEKRGFEEWKKMSGLPAYFRGYPFDQWREDPKHPYYTEGQKAKFNEMMSYLKGQQSESGYEPPGAGSVGLGGAQTYPGVAAELGRDKYEDAPSSHYDPPKGKLAPSGEPAQQQPSILKGVSRAIEYGTPFVDRAVARAKTDLPVGWGGTGLSYAENLAAEQAKLEQFARDNRWTAYAGEAVGTAPLWAIPGPKFGLSGLGGRVASTAAQGAAIGALQEGERSPDLTDIPETARRAAPGAAYGAAFGGAVPVVAHGVGKALRPLLRRGEPHEPAMPTRPEPSPVPPVDGVPPGMAERGGEAGRQVPGEAAARPGAPGLEADRPPQHEGRDVEPPGKPPTGVPLGAAKTTQDTAAIIKAGKGIFGRPTAGRNVIRQRIGLGGHDVDVATHRFEQHRVLSNRMTMPESIDVIRYMQHRSVDGPLGPLTISARFQQVADDIRGLYLMTEAKMKALDEFTRMQFEEDHFKQLWQDPRKAKDVWDGWLAKEGSKGFTKGKKYLDFDAGLAAGLSPKTYNIVDVALNDFANQNRVIAIAEVREIAKDQRYLKWIKFDQHPPGDWVKLRGYGAERGGYSAYAPADFARNYNNFVDRGFYEMHGIADAYKSIRSVTNFTTQLELSFSGYHALTITREALASGVADSAYALAHGQPIQAAKNVFKGLGYYAAKGRKAGQIYYGIAPGSSQEARAVQALIQVNAHLGKLEPALISGQTHNIVTEFRRGALAKDIANSWRHISEAEGFWRTVGTTGAEAGRAAGAVMNTFMAPLFQVYIPAVKRGMMMDQMVQWLNHHANASWDEILTQAAELSDIADERMGEMRQDNLFWNQTTKQSAQMAMRSTSWFYGSWAQYLGGVRELGGLRPGGAGFGRRTSYLFGDLFTTAMLGGITTYLMTGRIPNEKNYIWPATGGTTTEFAGKRTYQVPEIVNLPGSLKELIGMGAAVYDIYDQKTLKGIGEYFKNKENDFMKTMSEVLSGEDWRGKALINPYLEKPVAQQIFDLAWQAFGPISLKQEEPGPGSKLGGPLMRFLGIRPAGRRWADPKGYGESVEARLKREAKETKSYQRRRGIRHEDSMPRFSP